MLGVALDLVQFSNNDFPRLIHTNFIDFTTNFNRIYSNKITSKFIFSLLPINI